FIDQLGMLLLVSRKHNGNLAMDVCSPEVVTIPQGQTDEYLFRIKLENIDCSIFDPQMPIVQRTVTGMIKLDSNYKPPVLQLDKITKCYRNNTIIRNRQKIATVQERQNVSGIKKNDI